MKGFFLMLGLVNAGLNDDPKFSTSLPGDPVTTSTTCPNVTVLESVTETKWYDACLGLVKNVTLGTAEACKADCYADMHCSTWQLVNNSGTPHCYSGSVFHGCLSRGTGDTNSATFQNFEKDLMAGELIQHGFVNKVSDGTVESVGLMHFQESKGEDAEKMERCKLICYTDVTCGVWQYGKDGCWIEHLPTHKMTGTRPNSTWTKDMLAGETIEHTCPPYVKPEEGLPWPWIITGIVLGLLALGAIIYALTKKPKVKKTRAVKIEPKPTPVQYVYTLQPTVLIPQQSVVMAPPQPVVYETVAPTTTYVTQAAAPTTTYAAPTTAYAAPTQYAATQPLIVR